MKNKGFLFITIIAFAAASLSFAASTVPVTPVPPFATERVATVQVRVVPDHADWTYALGEPVKFTITVMADNKPVPGATVHYSLGPETYPKKEVDAPVPADGLVVESEPLPVPGFVRCIATCEIGGKKYKGIANAAYAPDKIAPTQTEPADFDAFWDEGKAMLAKIPLDAQMTLWPEQCTPQVDVYHVSFQNVGINNFPPKPSRIYGALCIPKGPGPFPAVLNAPFAGIRPHYGDKELAAHGIITLEIGIHGIPVNHTKEIYDQLAGAPLAGYPLFNLADRNIYYFRRAILGCVRANDFIFSLPQFDGKNLVVMGASQGGWLSLVTAALDSRVTGADATHPGYCDVTGDLQGRASGWPRMFYPEKGGKPSSHTTKEEIAVTGYYDGVNFARRIKVPVHFVWGYNDEICPPTSLFSAYNVVTAPKTLTLALELGHRVGPEQADSSTKWVMKMLGVKDTAP